MAKTDATFDQTFEKVTLKTKFGQRTIGYHFKYHFIVNDSAYTGETRYDTIPTESEVEIYYYKDNPSENSRTPYQDLREAENEEKSNWRLYVGSILILLGIQSAVKAKKSFKDV